MEPAQMGKFLARLRREAGLTQEALGARLGVTNKTVSRWENGNYLPDLEMLLLLGDVFGVTADELIRGRRLPDGAANQNPAAVPRSGAATQPGGAVNQVPVAVPGGAANQNPAAVPSGAATQPGGAAAQAPKGTAPDPFTLAQRQDYWRRKWLREHRLERLLRAVLCVLLPAAAFRTGLLRDIPLLMGGFSLLALACCLGERNRMMGYIESRAFAP